MASKHRYPGAKALAAYPHKTGYGDRLRLGAIGEAPAVDGGFSGPTAWTTAEYKGTSGFHGQAFFNEDRRRVSLAGVAALFTRHCAAAIPLIPWDEGLYWRFLSRAVSSGTKMYVISAGRVGESAFPWSFFDSMRQTAGKWREWRAKCLLMRCD